MATHYAIHPVVFDHANNAEVLKDPDDPRRPDGFSIYTVDAQGCETWVHDEDDMLAALIWLEDEGDDTYTLSFTQNGVYTLLEEIE